MLHRLDSFDAFPTTGPMPMTRPMPGTGRRHERHLVLRELESEFATSPRWTVATDAQQLLRLARTIKSGNIILPYGRGTGFRSLARMVWGLRALDNPGLRILVREHGRRLRLPQGVALMRLGASAILPIGLSPAAVRAQAQAFEGSRYRGIFQNDVDRVIRESRLLSRRARLAIAEFRSHTRQVLDPKSGDTPHTLVVLHPMTEAGAQAICASLESGLRDGVFCSEPDGVWVLLMACRPMDCQSVLERVLGVRFESLLVGWRKIGNRNDILRTVIEMDDLELAEPALIARRFARRDSLPVLE